MSDAQRRGGPDDKQGGADSLAHYRSKRDFSVTSEPAGEVVHGSGKALSFVIQKHAATRLHYDFRLELDGTLKSWAVPKGPSLDPAEKRLALQVEDHPLSYGGFEGVIPPHQYGSGTVIVWDRGSWEPIGDARAGMRSGRLKFRLHGDKLDGAWMLLRTRRGDDDSKQQWLLMKERDEAARPHDEFDVTQALPDSVLSSATIVTLPDGRPDKTRLGTVKKAAGKRESGAKASPEATPAAAAAAALAIAEPETKRIAAKAKPAKGGIAKVPLPALIKPQLATLLDEPPPGDDWSYEIKFDGYRIVARVDGKEVRLFTRNGNDWTAKLKGVAKAIAALGLDSGWLDGEIVVMDEQGLPSFQLLQNAFETSRTASIVFCLFDMPYFNGADLTRTPLRERRAALRALLADTSGTLRFSEDFNESPQRVLESACDLSLEGVIGKLQSAPYTEGRSSSWIKLKCRRRQEFVIAGFSDPQGSRGGFGALLLGVYDDAGDLRYCGRVGTGFNGRQLDAMGKQLKALEVAEPAFVNPPRGSEARGVHWIKPELVAEVNFSNWTDEGIVRQAAFHALRTDKPAREIRREQAVSAGWVAKQAKQEVAAAQAEPPPAKAKTTGRSAKAKAKAKTSSGTAAAATPTEETAVESTDTASEPSTKTRAKAGDASVAGVRISHPDRVIDEASGVTKLALAQFYEAVYPWLDPHLTDRPVALLRAPDGLSGELFFQKHVVARAIPGIRLLDPKLDPGHPALMVIDSVQALVGSVQMNGIELHTWNATAASIEQPDRFVLDLDPGEGLTWKRMLEAVSLVRAVLDELGLKSYLKTSGGKGMHVVVPCRPQHGWEPVKALARAVAEHLAATLPDRFSAKMGAPNRIGKVFVDFLRNTRGASTVTAFAVRARRGLGVSTPLAWEELPEVTGGAQWHVGNLLERLDGLAADPWEGFDSSDARLDDAMQHMGVEAAEPPKAAAKRSRAR